MEGRLGMDGGCGCRREIAATVLGKQLVCSVHMAVLFQLLPSQRLLGDNSFPGSFVYLSASLMRNKPNTTAARERLDQLLMATGN